MKAKAAENQAAFVRAEAVPAALADAFRLGQLRDMPLNWVDTATGIIILD